MTAMTAKTIPATAHEILSKEALAAHLAGNDGAAGELYELAGVAMYGDADWLRANLDRVIRGGYPASVRRAAAAVLAEMAELSSGVSF